MAKFFRSILKRKKIILIVFACLAGISGFLMLSHHILLDHVGVLMRHIVILKGDLKAILVIVKLRTLIESI